MTNFQNYMHNFMNGRYSHLFYCFMRLPLLFFILVVICVPLSALSENKQAPLHNTKIIVTLGPSSSGSASIKKIIENGADIFAFNLAHATHEWHEAAVTSARKCAQILNKKIDILVSLQGAKLRIGTFKSGKIYLIKNTKFNLDLDKALGTENRVNFPYPDIYKKLSVGEILYLDDGKIQLRITKIDDNVVHTVVVVGGELCDKKAISIPGIKLDAKPLMEADLASLEFAVHVLKPDFIALSFVQSAENIQQLRKALIDLKHPEIKIIAKIDNLTALTNISSIAEAADLLIVSRGELTVGNSRERLFETQADILKVANTNGKGIIITTQVMESMLKKTEPTNAEIMDISFAVMNHVYAIMFSNETSVGMYPDLVVQVADRIIRNVEESPAYLETLSDTASNGKK